MNRVYCRLVLSQLCIEICLVAIAVGLSKRDWRCNVEVVKEVCDMEENRVASLITNQLKPNVVVAEVVPLSPQKA